MIQMFNFFFIWYLPTVLLSWIICSNLAKLTNSNCSKKLLFFENQLQHTGCDLYFKKHSVYRFWCIIRLFDDTHIFPRTHNISCIMLWSDSPYFRRLSDRAPVYKLSLSLSVSLSSLSFSLCPSLPFSLSAFLPPPSPSSF